MAPKTRTAGTAVAKVAPQSTGIMNIEAASDEDLKEMEGVVGAGISDNVEDRGVPLLYIAQKGSKQVNPKEAKFIDGLAIGDAFNNLTGEIFKAEEEGVLFLPCFFRAVWNEWTPQDDGGGFHGSHDRDTPLVRQGKPREGRGDIIDLPDGHELILTHMYYGILKDSWAPIIVSMSSSNLSCSKIFQNLMSAQKVRTSGGAVVQKPGFWNVYRLQTYYDKNDAGDWYRWKVSVAEPNQDQELRALAKEFAMACARNEIQASKPEGAEGTPGKDGDGPI